MKQVLVIEGMFGMPIIENQLIKPMLAKHPRAFEYLTGEWNGQISLGRPDIIIGHSLGGNRAITMAQAVKPQALITLDPRWMSNWSWLTTIAGWQPNFTAPKGVKTYNFTHTPPVLFPGWQVTGAENVALLTTHFTIAGHPAVTAKFEELI